MKLLLFWNKWVRDPGGNVDASPVVGGGERSNIGVHNGAAHPWPGQERETAFWRILGGLHVESQSSLVVLFEGSRVHFTWSLSLCSCVFWAKI